MGKQALVLTDQDYGLDVPDWASDLLDSNFTVWSRSLHSQDPLVKVERDADILLLDLMDIDTGVQMDKLVDLAVAFCLDNGYRKGRVPFVVIARPSVSLGESQMHYFADILQPPLTSELISNRLISLMRLATMRREAERRVATFKKFGVGLPMVPPPHALDEQKLLYLGSGMAFLPIQVALPEETEVHAALSPGMALDYLEDQAFDALIVELRDYPEALIDFIGLLRRNPQYFSLPIILICHKQAMEDGLSGLVAGANDIVSFPFSDAFFENRIEILVREERYRHQLKSIFAEARLLMPTDEETKLYSEQFLKKHLEGIDQEHGNPVLTFAGIDLHFEDQTNGAEEIEDHPVLFANAGRMISSLMRAEDILARMDNGRLVAFLPDTDLMESRIALQRIRAIVQLSAFTDPRTNRPVNAALDFSMHYCEAATPEMDVDRIMKDLFENPVTRF